MIAKSTWHSVYITTLYFTLYSNILKLENEKTNTVCKFKVISLDLYIVLTMVVFIKEYTFSLGTRLRTSTHFIYHSLLR